MNKLDHVDADDLRTALEEATEAKPTKRLMIGLAYKDGVPVSTLTERYGVPRATVYYWLDRLADEPVEEAIRDADRPGRPRRLDDEELGRLRERLSAPPDGADSWSPEGVQSFIEREFGVSYSVGHVRRLMREADAVA